MTERTVIYNDCSKVLPSTKDAKCPSVHEETSAWRRDYKIVINVFPVRWLVILQLMQTRHDDIISSRSARKRTQFDVAVEKVTFHVAVEKDNLKMRLIS